jgi:hypothetical protein
MDVYNQFNNRVYNNCINKGGGVKSDNSDLENEALLLTKRYFNIQKIRELKK